MKKILFLLLFFLFAFPCFGNVQIENAEEFFRKGDYAKTIEIYETLIQVERINNPQVFYNLSNAYFRNGNLGLAILNINKAHRLAPRDRDIRSNFEYLSSMAGENAYGDFTGFLLSWFSLNEVTVLASGLIIIILLGFSVFFINKNEFAKKSAVFCLILLIPVLTVLFFKLNSEIFSNKAVVLNASAARSGPGINNPEIFNLAEGKTIRVRSSSGAWSNIVIQSGNETLNGWIENSNIGKI
ncbi:MAG: tetratricopeptide repeat protein [Endomicrobia bacterium]|nr:tetratricopeptide repeat protein [Endomicrobiia bacterium]MCL2506192.1 tetratricopeptide repeat protein [Endomicrobiia bacterium]